MIVSSFKPSHSSTLVLSIFFLCCVLNCTAFIPKSPEKNLLLKAFVTRDSEQRLEQEGEEDVSICIIGGGVSGLAAGITAMEHIENKIGGKKDSKKEQVVLLEKSLTLGGRVQSDKTHEGYTLDRGFAVFIEEYPFSKKLLDYESLNLGRFLPGSLVKTCCVGRNSDYAPLHKVADPLRVPSDLLTALLAPIGTNLDKVKAVFLLYNVFSNTVEELFEQKETDTLSCLKDKYGFSNKFIKEFFEPFLEGIYLAPLNEQSSRMFHFVFKMFAEGSATLPEGGMGKVTDQLAKNAKAANVDIRVGDGLSTIVPPTSKSNETLFTIETTSGKVIKSKSVIIATDGPTSHNIISSLPDFQTLTSHEDQIQRSVGCIYYGFNTSLPISEPILILNGDDRSPVSSFPVNNVCFPSAVARGYAPDGYNLCSVTILEPCLKAFAGREDDLDKAVRKQLKSWFPNHSQDIETSWEMKGMYEIQNAQPGQLTGPTPANVNGGRDCSYYRGMPLPDGLFLCGDHMSTATLNGALESGVNAGKESARFL